jgi:hypothetical protein
LAASFDQVGAGQHRQVVGVFAAFGTSQ